MIGLFTEVLNMSLTASVIIAVVMAIRFPLRKAPKIYSYILWGAVFIRLACPLYFELSGSPFEKADINTTAIMSDYNYIEPYNTYYAVDPEYADLFKSGFEPVVADGLSSSPHIVTSTDGFSSPKTFSDTFFPILAFIWLAGVVGMLGYSLISYLLLVRKTSNAKRIDGNIFCTDNIPTPFVMGIFNPKIILPNVLDEKESEYIILHERTHIKRFDHVVKLFAFIILSVHWFNPLVWISFISMSKDMEMACDEAVLNKISGIKKVYSLSLLSFSTSKMLAPTPLAFSETGVKQRIKNIAGYKRPSIWVGIVCFLTVTVVGVFMLTNSPKTYASTLEGYEELKGNYHYNTQTMLSEFEIGEIICLAQDEGYTFRIKITAEKTGGAFLFTPPNGEPYMDFRPNAIEKGENEIDFFISNEKIEAMKKSSGRNSTLTFKILYSDYRDVATNSATFDLQFDLKPNTMIVYKRGAALYLPEKPKETEYGLEKFTDVRSHKEINKTLKDIEKISEEMLISLTYNEGTIFPDKTRLPHDLTPEKLMEIAKNPGLGIREIHKSGITGKGVRVAIIDQPMYTNHPEFAGKIQSYLDLVPDHKGSMHGTAVASTLVGESTGTAPGAKLYYAGASDGTPDAEPLATALDWIMEENKKLPSNDKIRVVSVSAAPSGRDAAGIIANTNLWDESVKKARESGIIVLDFTTDNGIVAPGYYDLYDQEDVEKMKPGLPSSPPKGALTKLVVPSSYRTTAEQYNQNTYSYIYFGDGGLSLGLPYTEGVLALGFEVCPEYTGEQMLKVLMDTAYEKDGVKYINPTNFIETLKNSK